MKQKLSERMKGNKFASDRKQTPDELIIRRTANLGKKRSEETSAKMSESQKGRVHSEETRLKMSESAKNKPALSDDTRRKLSEAAARQWAKYRLT